MGKKKPKVEILVPIEKPAIPSASVGMALERLVEQKVAEILSQKDAALLEPWFRSRQEAHEIKRQQTVPEQRKWSVYFERYGCLSCWTKKEPHAGSGLCRLCRPKIGRHLSEIVRELSGQKEKPVARACDICGQQFRPMTEGNWENVRALHEEGKRHQRAVRLLRPGLPGR